MEPFIGEIRAFSFNRIPKGWALCDGSLLPINSNQALFALLGTTYGGNGVSNFALPDLRGRVPIHPNNNEVHLGLKAGEEAHKLNTQELPPHTHSVKVSSNAASAVSPSQNTWAISGEENVYSNVGTNLVPMDSKALTESGGSLAHNNMQPYTVLNYCIAVQGIFPSRD